MDERGGLGRQWILKNQVNVYSFIGLETTGNYFDLGRKMRRSQGKSAWEGRQERDMTRQRAGNADTLGG